MLLPLPFFFVCLIFLHTVIVVKRHARGCFALYSLPTTDNVLAALVVVEVVKELAEYAEKARELSVLGGNIERALSRQLIFLPQKFGLAAQAAPIRRPADQLLSQLPTPRLPAPK